MSTVDDPFSVRSSVSLASTSILESLVSRLFEAASIPFEEQPAGAGTTTSSSSSHDKEDMEASDADFSSSASAIIQSISLCIVPFIPKINVVLSQYISDSNPCGTIASQSGDTIKRLGHRGLQLVKLVEAIVRLGINSIDEGLCTHRVLKTCLDLFCMFENNSILHLSVQRIVFAIVESTSNRR
jgi:hypothetical protein